jgi:hypothetical protein
MKIKQSSATFRIDRGPVDEVYWSVMEKRPEILFVGLSVKKIVSFDTDYLTSFFNSADRLCDYLILEKELNATRT